MTTGTPGQLGRAVGRREENKINKQCKYIPEENGRSVVWQTGIWTINSRSLFGLMYKNTTSFRRGRRCIAWLFAVVVAHFPLTLNTATDWQKGEVLFLQERDKQVHGTEWEFNNLTLTKLWTISRGSRIRENQRLLLDAAQRRMIQLVSPLVFFFGKRNQRNSKLWPVADGEARI